MPNDTQTMTQITEFGTMSIPTITETNWSGLQLAAVCSPTADQTERILAAFGPSADGMPKVDQARWPDTMRTCRRTCRCRFRPTTRSRGTPQEKVEFRCRVVELLDPTQHMGDEFDGIFCRIRKGNFEVNLPLVELFVPDESPNFQLIEDYSFWFWNWR